jgi:hypothetical protein
VGVGYTPPKGGYVYPPNPQGGICAPKRAKMKGVSMSERVFVGVDPGSTGAVAVITPYEVVVDDFETREGLRLLQDVSAGMLIGSDHVTAAVEAVHSMPKQGVATTFKFGVSTGTVHGWLEALGIPFVMVTPTKWQKVVYDSQPKTGDNKADSLTLARKLFPNVMGRLTRKKDHNRADALLIAEWCRRTQDY